MLILLAIVGVIVLAAVFEPRPPRCRRPERYDLLRKVTRLDF